MPAFKSCCLFADGQADGDGETSFGKPLEEYAAACGFGDAAHDHESEAEALGLRGVERDGEAGETARR